MARRRYRRGHRRGGYKLPIISLAILGGQIALANTASGSNDAAGLTQKLSAFASYYTGFNLATGGFVPGNLAIGYGPWLIKRFVLPIARPGRSLGRMLPVSIS